MSYSCRQKSVRRIIIIIIIIAVTKMLSLVQLRRSNTSVPWGFRMNGGVDFSQPLYVQKVRFLFSAVNLHLGKLRVTYLI